MRYEQSVYWTTVMLQAAAPNFFGSYFVVGHPSAGTNWLCNLVSGCLDIPVFFAWTEKLPPLDSKIFHVHRFMGGLLPSSRTIYMYRDGRDTMVSLFFKTANTPWMGKWRDKFHQETGLVIDTAKIVDQLPAYIDWHFTKRQPGSMNWRDHISYSLLRRYKSVSYEALKQDPHNVLRSVLSELGSSKLREDKISSVIQSNHLVNTKSENNNYQIRSGCSGEWRQYFTEEASKCFQKYAGKELVRLGYETDHSWVKCIL